MSRFYEIMQKLGADVPQTSALDEVERRDCIAPINATLADYGSTAAPGSALPESLRFSTREVDLSSESRLVMATDPGHPGADRFRYLRMRLRTLWNTGKLRTVLITSAMPEDGKSLVALNLATALLENGKQSVLLIDADLHHPSVTSTFRMNSHPGLSECLQEQADPHSAIVRLNPLGLHVMPTGHLPAHPADLLQHDTLSKVLRSLRPSFDWILLDSPPVLPITDTNLLSHETDGTLLVVRAGHTPIEAVEHSIATLGKNRLVGTVLNGAVGTRHHEYGYYNYYTPANGGR